MTDTVPTFKPDPWSLPVAASRRRVAAAMVLAYLAGIATALWLQVLAAILGMR